MTKPLIIAHRGACGYLPEHSRGAKALAYGMGADYLEQDVIATQDGQLVVLHDLYLDAVADVRGKFPGREREDGRYYCMDFDLAELRGLRFHERIDIAAARARYAGRFPPSIGNFRVVTLEEEIGFVESLNRATGGEVGIYPEIKNPAWHRQHGFDLAAAVIDTLEARGYLEAGRRVFLQCFDAATLKAVRARVGANLPIIQLLDSRTEISGALLDDIAGYATGIGPSLRLIYHGKNGCGEPRLTRLVEDAHARGLQVHPYTLRADDLPADIGSFDELLALCVNRLGVDAVFTDFTDRVANYLSRGPSSAASPGT